MAKQHSKKFWVTFWSISVILLTGWYFFLQIKNQNIQTINTVIDYLPVNLSKKTELKSVAYFAKYLFNHDNQEKIFLILFQNNMELRPGGGYIGSFGILKMKNGRIVDLQTHDLSNFDVRVPNGIEPPYPMKQILGIKSWKLRDSNFSPDFPTNAKKAEYFYSLGQGQEKFDGVVAINTNVLSSFLNVMGPIKIAGYPGIYNNQNAILNLEYQVEKGYAKQGIKKEDRKSIMNILASKIMKKSFQLSNSKKIELAKIILQDLKEKDIQLYFKNSHLEEKAQIVGWAGTVNKKQRGDYLMLVDANLGSFKSDYYIKRSFDYTVDLSKNIPTVDLKITYQHTGKVKDWMTKNYLTYLRVFVPDGSWLLNAQTLGKVKFGNELGRKYFGLIVKVPLAQKRTVELKYALPKNLILKNYNLLIQKQSGVENIPGHLTVIRKNGTREEENFILTSNWSFGIKK